MTTLDICVLQWNTYNTRMQKAFDELDGTEFQVPVAEGFNSPSWILGHLVDTDDMLLEVLGIRARIYPDLSRIYHHERGSNQTGHLAKSELMSRWKVILAELERSFKSWTESEWLSKHAVVSEQDFQREPHRNRLNVMLTRVAHKASHLGQIAMMKKR